jgi:hypothetical protein
LKFFRRNWELLEKKREKEGKIKDLVEKLKRGEITSKDALKELEKRGLLESERWEIIPWVVYFVFLLLPAVSRQFKLDFLAFFCSTTVNILFSDCNLCFAFHRISRYTCWYFGNSDILQKRRT